MQREWEPMRTSTTKYLEAKRAVNEFEISRWVREFAMNWYTEDEINNVIDIFVIECGLLTLSEVAEKSVKFTRNFFMSRRLKLGFASAIVKAISSLVERSEASSNLNSTEPLPDVPPDVHNKTPNKDGSNSNLFLIVIFSFFISCICILISESG